MTLKNHLREAWFGFRKRKHSFCTVHGSQTQNPMGYLFLQEADDISRAYRRLNPIFPHKVNCYLVSLARWQMPCTLLLILSGQQRIFFLILLICGDVCCLDEKTGQETGAAADPGSEWSANTWHRFYSDFLLFMTIHLECICKKLLQVCFTGKSITGLESEMKDLKDS